MVNMSDKIGYIYWFCVLFTISFGGAAGIFTSIKNKTNMELICNQKLDYYEKYLNEQNIATPLFNDNEAVMSKVNKIENELMYVPFYFFNQTIWHELKNIIYFPHDIACLI